MCGNPAGVQAPFAVGEMRKHLLACLESGSLTPFPKLEGQTGGRRRKVIVIDVNESGVTCVK